MTAVDLSRLSAYEQQWVAVTSDWKVVDHDLKLADLRRKLGGSAASYGYFFVPSSKTGYCGPCPP